jgi:hypothetical protein
MVSGSSAHGVVQQHQENINLHHLIGAVLHDLPMASDKVLNL